MAFCLFLIDLNKDHLTKLSNPLDIKDLLLSTPTVRPKDFAPFVIVTKVSAIVKRVFNQMDLAR